MKKKLFILGLISIFVLTSVGPVLAAEDNNRGPQEPVGVQIETGPQKPTGPTEPVGPQQPTGPQIEQTVPVNEPAQEDLVVDNSSENGDTGQVIQDSQAGVLDGGDSGVDNFITVDNNADTNNTIDLSLNTGENQIGNNSVVGNIDTGDIESLINLINISNSEFAPGSSVGSELILGADTNQIVLIPSLVRLLLENSNTGPFSENLNTVDNSNIVSIFDLNNYANTINNIGINANTGRNDILNSTKVGNLTTGDINLGVNLINIANLLMPNTLFSVDIWNVLGPFNGGIIIPELANIATGPNSSNQNLLSSSNDLAVFVNQDANLDNSLNVNTNTGGNQIGDNTATGDISTGDTKIKSALTNIVNAVAEPVVYLINVFGKWTGSLFGLDPSRVIVNQINDTTGPDSLNQNIVNSENDVNFSLDNNANIANRININANTGDNKIKNNTVIGDIKTGSINITENIINVLNSLSEDVGRFTLRIVNIFGDWNGDASSGTSYNQNQLNESANYVANDNYSDNSPIGEEEAYANFTGYTKNSVSSSVSGDSNLQQCSKPSSTEVATTTPNDPVTGQIDGKKFPWKIALAILLALILASWAILEILALRKKNIRIS